MGDRITGFVWQREHKKNWISYTAQEIFVINKALMKKQKTVTLPQTDKKRKIVVYLEKMYQRNVISDFEQRVRCVLYYGDWIVWSWKDDDGSFTCYNPRVAFYLECGYRKKVEKIRYFQKDEYEIDVINCIQTNVQTQFKRSIMRENAQVYSKSNEDFAEITTIGLGCEEAIKKFCEEFEPGILNLINDVPVLSPVEDQESINIIDLSSESTETEEDGESNGIAVDPYCPNALNYHVYTEDSLAFSATLNFTDLYKNANKFFLIQLLKHNRKKSYALWQRNGRVGLMGQSYLTEVKSLQVAKQMFDEKFHEKTRNKFGENFQRLPNKYDLVLIEAMPVMQPIPEIIPSKLPDKLQDLMKFISNKKKMQEITEELNLDCRKIPLGSLTSKQIQEGYIALDKVASVLGKKSYSLVELCEASSAFYMKIPHDFGRRAPPIIDTMEAVYEKIDMLEELSRLRLSMEVMNSSGNSAEAQIDKYYRCLECELEAIPEECEEFKVIQKNVTELHGPTHINYTLTVKDVFRCNKGDDYDLYERGTHKLLWHGSRTANWIGILKNGLRIAPPEIPSSGNMFGKGVYFADVASKSANYCYANHAENEGLLILCEVALGTPYFTLEAKNFEENLPHGYESVFGSGKLSPQAFEHTVLSSSALLPKGPLVFQKASSTLNYNEYIVYNTDQIAFRYLVRVKFNFM